MDDNERKIKMQELLELKKQLLEQDNNTQNINEDNQGNERGKVKVRSNGKAINVEEYQQPIQPYNPFDKNGMINIITLSVITFVFECLFLFLSFMIFS